ncbi:MAG: ATP-dependent helicase [Bdellovibrionales bacterium]|nr:ATP-dependent helicase [Bdellovibrionales bacterium]
MGHFNFENLNPEQRQAVAHNEGPLLILAGAGSGKTRVLVSRVARLIGESPGQPPGICVLTFTNKAARELKVRVNEQMGRKTQSLWAGTFHSFGLQILRKYARKIELNPKFHVADSSDGQAIVKDLLIHMHNSGKNDFQVDRLLNIMQEWKAFPSREPAADAEYLAVAQALIPKYESRKKALGVVDFEDLLLKPLELFERHPETLHKVRELFQYVMVDEFQDTNEVQMKLLRILCDEHRNLAVVGDDDQAIYGWRGAQVKNILEFPKMYEGCEVIQLNRNYRSSSAILDVANKVISKNTDRHGKVLKAESQAAQIEKPEVFVFETDQEEVEQVAKLIEDFHQKGHPYKDIAVLYRSNGQGGFLETELRQARVPYSLSGGTAFFDRREVKDVLAYLMCLFMPKEVSLRRILNVPLRGIGDESLNRLSEYHQEHSEESFVSLLRRTSNMEFLQPAVKQGIEKFFQDLDELRRPFFTKEPIDWETFLPRYFINIGYRNYLQKFCKNDEALKRRWAGVEIFARVFSNFMAKKSDRKTGLKEFVDMMLLRDYEDELESGEKDQVQLMTMHAAKGLEFPVVFVIGVEEDMIPHHKLGSDIAEERRLFYVALTRAMESLILTHARTRKRYGKLREVAPSRFLLEIPSELIRQYPNGYRPVSGDARALLIEDLQAKLAASMEKQRIEPQKY